MNVGTRPVPIFVLTGFLGSGKTTLLNALLKHPDFANTAVIVNEFGQIGLDHFLVEQSRDSIVLLDAGCLCCTIAESLHETLADLNFRKIRGELPPFSRVIVETTGLADPAPILNTLLGNRLVTDHYRLEAVVVCVDAQHAIAELDAHVEVASQIAVADRLVITKVDLVPLPAELSRRLRDLNPLAPIVECNAGATAIQAFAPVEGHHVRTVPLRDNGHVHYHALVANPAAVNRHDAHIRAYCFVVEDPASWAGLAAWWRLISETYGERILRCKGILRMRETNEVIFMQCVRRVFHRPERLAEWPDEDRRSRLVCIAHGVDEAELRSTLDVLQLPPGSDPNGPISELTLTSSFTRNLQ